MPSSSRFTGRSPNPASAGRSPFATCTRRSIEADGHKIAPAYATPGRLPRRPRHFAPYRIARFILIALALIGTVAIARLVLGLLNVHAVTNHFRVH
jgi:hypothetical protein